MAKTRHRAPGGGRRRRFSVWRLLFLLALVVLTLVAGSGAGFIMASVKGMPSLADIEPRAKLTSLILDHAGQPVHELFEENRKPVPLSRVPAHLQNAFIAIEDASFWTHHGFDLKGLARAAYVNLVKGGVHQGGSTITQQLARNAFLSLERTLRRKVQELLFAVQLERRYTKTEILEFYLNFIYFGNRAFGVQAAAETYFGKDVGELTLAEAAFLAGIAKGPSTYDPYRAFERAKSRQELVLDRMVEVGLASPEAAQAAREEVLTLVPPRDPFRDYPHPWFVDFVVRQLLRQFDEKIVYGGGLRIYTTLDQRVQNLAQEAIRTVLDPVYPLDQPEPQPEAAVVVMDPHTGHIKAMVGGRSRPDGKLLWNGAVDARRQPGSAIKPLVVYAPAVAMGRSPGAVVDDSPKTYPQPAGQKPWTPMNYDLTFRGLVTYREALKDSINVPAIKVLEEIGIRQGLEVAGRMGISTFRWEGRTNDLGLATAIGGLTEGVRLLDMVQAYGVLASGGVRVEPVAVTRVVDRYGNVLYEARPHKQVVLSDAVAYLVTDMLKDVIKAGTGRRAEIGRPAAGKTGTTDDYADAWFIGYTPDLVAGVWMGYRDEQTPMTRPQRVVGGTYPAQIWNLVMRGAHEGLPPRDFERPRNIVEVEISTKSGKLPSRLTPPQFIRTELFIRGTEPTELDDAFVEATVCQENPNELYDPFCGCTPSTRIFLNRPPVEPYVDEKGRTYAPADQAMALPSRSCLVSLGAQGQGEAQDQGGEPLEGEPDVVIQMTSRKYAWEPSVIRVRKGQHVRLLITAVDVPHGFGLPGYNIYRTLPVGEAVTVDFIAEKPGTFAFFCTVYCGVDHARHIGRLQVLDDR